MPKFESHRQTALLTSMISCKVRVTVIGIFPCEGLVMVIVVDLIASS